MDFIDLTINLIYYLYMERGTIVLSNNQAIALRKGLLNQGFANESLLRKLEPVINPADLDADFIVEISEEDAETMLDSMPIPNQDTDPNLISSRIKIQNFLAKCRFG